MKPFKFISLDIIGMCRILTFFYADIFQYTTLQHENNSNSSKLFTYRNGSTHSQLTTRIIITAPL